MSVLRFSGVLVLVAGMGMATVGCGNKEAERSEPSQVAPAPAEAPAAAPVAEPAPAAPAPAAPAPAGDAASAVTENPDGTVSVKIESVGDTMAFNVKDITVPAGKKITVTLQNNATTDVMKHNWLLVQKGKVEEVGMAGLTAGEARGYIPENPAIIAHTELAGPGKTVTVTFDAPPAGEYEFLCSFPGHYMLMRGTFTVKA